MRQEQFLELLRKYREGTCSPQEKVIVENWFETISTPTLPFSDSDEEFISKRKSWEHVDRSISSRRLRKTYMRWPVYAVAASIALLIFVVFAPEYQSVNPVTTGSAVKAPIEDKLIVNDGPDPLAVSLDDGSKIRLMPGSSIRYADHFRAQRREVYLDGEALFDVAHDASRPFLVYTDALTTRVLGTTFVIRAYAKQEEIIVSVQTGKVSVYTNVDHTSGMKPKQEVILSSNEEVIYNAEEQLTLKKIVNEPQVILQAPTLKDSYTNAPVTEILTSLELNYGIEIRYDARLLSNCTLTSDMSDEGFYEQIKIICNALGARYRVDETAIVIEATGCGAE